MSIESDIQKLAVDAVIELLILDATDIGGTISRFHCGTNQLKTNVIWQGNTYTATPYEAKGFEVSGRGRLPRPSLAVVNTTGLMSALALSLDDLIGAKVTRKRTLAKYLDAANFPGGVNPTADPAAGWEDDIYYVERKSGDNKIIVSFELSSLMDVEGVKIPRRQIIQNLCTWQYRDSNCGYAGGPVATINDVPTSDAGLDRCSKKLGACKLRFGTYAELPFGGFPAAGLVRQ